MFSVLIRVCIKKTSGFGSDFDNFLKRVFVNFALDSLCNNKLNVGGFVYLFDELSAGRSQFTVIPTMHLGDAVNK